MIAERSLYVKLLMKRSTSVNSCSLAGNAEQPANAPTAICDKVQTGLQIAITPIRPIVVRQY